MKNADKKALEAARAEIRALPASGKSEEEKAAEIRRIVRQLAQAVSDDKTRLPIGAGVPQSMAVYNKIKARCDAAPADDTTKRKDDNG